MSEQAPVKSSFRLEDVLTVNSDKLKELRVIVSYWRESSAVMGSAAQFRLVVDTNVVLGDLLWLVAERKNETAKTALMEAVEAETIDMYAPPSLFDEVEEHLPLIAAKKGLDLNRLHGEWATYQTRIKIVEPDAEKVHALKNGVDPDDAEFVALAQTIDAVGVVSKDKHIGQMGGNHISVMCVTHLRNYSRSTAIELNIKVNGVTFAKVGYAAIAGIFAGGKALIDGIGKAPDWVKVVLLVGGVAIALHPGARAKVAEGFKVVLDGIREATPFVIAEIVAAIELAQQKKAESQRYLDNAMKELGLNQAITIEHGVNT
jgi:predicted nucleic acid-binding protein